MSGSSIVVNPAAIDHLPPAVRAPIVAAFSHSLQTVFLVAVPFAVLAFALSWLMKEIPLAHDGVQPTPRRIGSGDANGATSEGAEHEVPAEVAAL